MRRFFKLTREQLADAPWLASLLLAGILWLFRSTLVDGLDAPADPQVCQEAVDGVMRRVVLLFLLMMQQRIWLEVRFFPNLNERQLRSWPLGWRTRLGLLAGGHVALLSAVGVQATAGWSGTVFLYGLLLAVFSLGTGVWRMIRRRPAEERCEC